MRSSEDNITKIYRRIRHRARQIVSQYPPPVFYNDFSKANTFIRRFFETDPLVSELRSFVAASLENDFGHGLDHAVKVSLDAGVLMSLEGKRAGYPAEHIRQRIRVTQCAGLLHDMKRKEKDHAVAGSHYAREVLSRYALRSDEVEDICRAIRNHEAFRETVPSRAPEGLLVSDCLYDADKFRWGPDNFADTVWGMVSYLRIPLRDFMARYPRGLAKLATIKSTFRSETGKIYGPQFIDTGLAIGNKLYTVIQTEFASFL